MLKQRLYDYCCQLAENRISSIQGAIEDAQGSANNETKSTAGDKHDTARAMMQLEVEQKSKQLAEAKKLKMALAQFSPDSGSQEVMLGSLVKTSVGMYYISISIGKIEVEGQLFFAISPISPIASSMLGLKVGDSFTFNGKQQTIKELH